MKKDLISVIVPTYNVEKYLDKCIDSIVNQSYKNLEIILVDDGSSDKSGEICDKWGRIDSRIKVIHKENGGLSDARNIGLDVANGEYISFIDSDDFIEKDFYVYLKDLSEKYNSDIVECNFVKAYESKLNEFEFPKNDFESITITDSYGALKIYTSFDDDISTNSVVVWNKLYKSEIFNDIRFPVGKTHEDQFTMYKILSKATTFVTSSEVKYGYFQRENSIINKKFSEKRLEIFSAYDEVISFLHKMNYTELEEKFQRRYLQTLIDFVDKAVLENDEKNKINKVLKKLFDDRYKIMIDFIENSNIYKDRKRFYIGFKKEFDYKITL